MTHDSHPRAIAAVLVGAAAAALAVAGYGLASGPERFVAAGTAYPGTVTDLVNFTGFFLATLAAMITLGALVHIVTTATPDDDGRIDPATFRVHLFVERLAPVWALGAAAMAITTGAAAAGVPVTRLVASGAALDAIAASEQARGWCAATLFAVIVAFGVRFTVRWLGHAVLMLPAALGVLAAAVTGNPGQGPDHDFATSAVIVFAVSAAVLVGAKTAALLSPPPLDLRHRVLLTHAIAGAVTMAFGVVLAAVFVPVGALFDTLYGRVTLGTAVLLTVILVADVAQLRGWTRSWLPAATTVATIGVVGGLSALAVDAPPRFLTHEFTVWDVFLGYELPGGPSLANLVTVWRFDPLLGTAALVLAAAYLYGVHRLKRRDDAWPVGRTVAWISGCAALLIATSSGVRAYGSAMFSVHMGEHMALNMFVPVLLVLGAPVTLALRVLPPAGAGGTPGPREWVVWFVHSPITRFLSHPITAFSLFVGSLYAVYFTPLFDTLIRYHWGHEFMSVHFLLTGYLFYWGIIGVDPGPSRLPFLGRLGLLFAVMPFHAFFGIATMTMSTNLGDYFYRSLALPWVGDLSDDQHLGGAIAWGSSELPVILVVVALVAQWARQDRRDGARKDRHSDSGYDDDLDAYNAMLAELQRQRR
ncbi:cytochrome c oxidase assembly protein [Mycobacterium sp. ACS4331]|uniref:cytochrome c oxidase assembly protein n=1 Tax=Mycobacterium sp. ACS4331 TaxID=1834121 RepID=UPI000800607B|nr:cytochrome c oxidase assembly protein [Mycobacterium sp. ACS4331]OBF27907.1 hypothetical protein A5727_02145 [Mycobacterium sp. ACS4331]